MASTNNNPQVILLYYLLQVLNHRGEWFIEFSFFCLAIAYIPGVPAIIRSDCGTENSSLSACQMLLRHDDDDEFKGEKSFRYGSSTTNTVSS